jgi:hypothetical protein
MKNNITEVRSEFEGFAFFELQYAECKADAEELHDDYLGLRSELSASTFGLESNLKDILKRMTLLRLSLNSINGKFESLTGICRATESYLHEAIAEEIEARNEELA